MFWTIRVLRPRVKDINSDTKKLGSSSTLNPLFLQDQTSECSSGFVQKLRIDIASWRKRSVPFGVSKRWIRIRDTSHAPVPSIFAVEKTLGDLDWRPAEIDFESRRKTGFLINDLTFFRAEVPKAPTGPEFSIHNLQEAIGCLYDRFRNFVFRIKAARQNESR